jgi:hypothetical protein
MSISSTNLAIYWVKTVVNIEWGLKLWWQSCFQASQVIVQIRSFGAPADCRKVPSMA